MAKFPLELFTSGTNGTSADRTGKLYDKLLGLCRWFQIGVNGIVYPVEQTEPRLDASYLCTLVDSRSGNDRERVEQFAAQLVEVLSANDLAFEGTFEIFSADKSPDTWSMVKLAYSRRPFWKWY
jgi:hypothetical protein